MLPAGTGLAFRNIRMASMYTARMQEGRGVASCWLARVLVNRSYKSFGDQMRFATTRPLWSNSTTSSLSTRSRRASGGKFSE